MLALDEHVEDDPAAPLMHTFEAILEDYQSLLDNSVGTYVAAGGLPAFVCCWKAYSVLVTV